MKRGDVYLATFAAPIGRRPVVLVTRTSAFSYRTRVTVVPVTRRTRGIASEVPLDERDGLAYPCVANCDDVATIHRRTLTRRVARLSTVRIGEIDTAMRFALGLD